VHALHSQQLEVATIARQVGVSRMTVYRYLRMHEPPVGKQPVSRSAEILDAYKPYLLQRWGAGCRNAQQLLSEIRAQGYAYSGRTVNRYLTRLRRATGEKPRSFRDAAPQELAAVREKAGRRRDPRAQGKLPGS